MLKVSFSKVHYTMYVLLASLQSVVTESYNNKLKTDTA